MRAGPGFLLLLLVLAPGAGFARKTVKKKAERSHKAEAAPAKPVDKSESKGAPAELLARYAAAIGGPSFERVQSRLSTGMVVFTPASGGAAQKAQLELAWRADGKAREIWTLPEGRLRRIYDGTKAWVVGPGIKRRVLRAAERAELSRSAALFAPALVLDLAGANLEKTEQHDGRAVSILKTKNGDFIWFDAQTALPQRVDLLEERPEPERAGEFQPTQVFYEDWRFVGAVQLPHRIRRVRPGGETTYQLVEVKQDVELADRLFKKPTWWRR